jgi:hypothetical protein
LILIDDFADASRVEHFPFLNFMPAKLSSAIRQRAARIKLFLCDVDGVLTDGQDPSSLALPRQRS